ncbi:MAG TPA: ATP synthase F1 subunit delta [Gaiellaceae bacterium]|nr:ATP synthase F1 subunit delta [Gaiellaceae bacterium]
MPVAERVYANALFEAAKEQGKLAVVREELADFLRTMEEVPELRALLENPEIDTTDRVEALRSILAGVDETVRNFLLLVAEKGRSAQLPAIVREFEALVARDEGILDVELTTAFELSDDEAQSILSRIEGASDRKLRASRKVDPNLIGGFVLQAGSHRADASVRARLQTLRRELTGTGRS